MSVQPPRYQPLQEQLGYQFTRLDGLVQALTHRSHSAGHNERLEFLGDSVLNCVVSVILYNRHPQEDEGRLSRMRSHLVRQDCLARLGEKLELSPLLRLGEGEIKSGGASRPSILADAVEAIIGAILMDGGFDAADRVIRSLIEPLLDDMPVQALGKDAKTRLQEFLQAARLPLPAYQVVVEGGTAQSTHFEVRCDVAPLQLSAIGTGTSRRMAEQAAAEHLFEHIPPHLLKKHTS